MVSRNVAQLYREQTVSLQSPERCPILNFGIAISCLIDQAVKASGENGVLDAAGTDAFWETIAVDVAANAPEYLMNAVAVLKSQAQKKKALIILSAMIVGTKVAGNIAAVNLPKQGVGHSSSDSNNQKCDASAEANKGKFRDFIYYEWPN